jgi:hypothetical protein
LTLLNEIWKGALLYPVPLSVPYITGFHYALSLNPA